MKFSEYVEKKEKIQEGLSNTWNAAKNLAGGVAAGVRAATDAVAGPAAKFDSAKKAIEDLAASIEKNPNLKQYPAVSMKDTTLAQWLRKVVRALDREKGNMPQLQQAAPQYAARNPQQAPQQQPAQAQQPAQQAGMKMVS